MYFSGRKQSFSSECESLDSVESVRFFKSVLHFMEEDCDKDSEDSGFTLNLNQEKCSSYGKNHLLEPTGTSWAISENLVPTNSLTSSESIYPYTESQLPLLNLINVSKNDSSLSLFEKNLLFIRLFQISDFKNHPLEYPQKAEKQNTIPNEKCNSNNGGKTRQLNPNAEEFLAPSKDCEKATVQVKEFIPTSKRDTHHKNLDKDDFLECLIDSSIPLQHQQDPEGKNVTSDSNEETSSESANPKICKFCLKNGEPEQVYMSHFTKNSNGIVTCPILQKHVCEICGATGMYSHTRKYCPNNKGALHHLLMPHYKKIINGVLI